MAEPGSGSRARRVAGDVAVYRRLLGARVRGDWQYRTSFLVFFVAQAFVAVADLGVVWVLFTNVDSLAGWSATEVLLLYGLSGTAFGLADALVSPVETASRHIRQGTFDQILTRPVGALWQLLGTEFALRRFGRPVQPLAVLVVVLATGGLRWTPASAALVAIALASGTAIYGALWVLTSSVAFWTVETQEIANSFTYGGNALAKYPVDILSVWLRRLVTFVIPLAWVAHLPAARLFDRPLPFGLPGWTAWTGPLVAGLMVLAARTVWTGAVRHYRSTGS